MQLEAQQVVPPYCPPDRTRAASPDPTAGRRQSRWHSAASRCSCPLALAFRGDHDIWPSVARARQSTTIDCWEPRNESGAVLAQAWKPPCWSPTSILDCIVAELGAYLRRALLW